MNFLLLFYFPNNKNKKKKGGLYKYPLTNQVYYYITQANISYIVDRKETLENEERCADLLDGGPSTTDPKWPPSKYR